MKGEYLKNHFRHETIKRPKQSGQTVHEWNEATSPKPEVEKPNRRLLFPTYSYT